MKHEADMYTILYTIRVFTFLKFRIKPSMACGPRGVSLLWGKVYLATECAVL